jgi:hypothetical protein
MSEQSKDIVVLQGQMRKVSAPLTREEHGRGFSQASLDKYLRERHADNAFSYYKEVHDRHKHAVKLAEESIVRFWADRGLTVAEAKIEPTPFWPETTTERDRLEKIAGGARALLEDAAWNLAVAEKIRGLQSRQLAKDKHDRVLAAQREIAAREVAMTAALAELPEV